MFWRTVTIEDDEIFVCCLPSTPWQEVYRRAEAVWKAKQESEAALTEQKDRTNG